MASYYFISDIFQSVFSCDETAPDICYATLRVALGTSHHVGQFNFTSVTASVANYQQTSTLLSSIVALDSNEVLVVGQKSGTLKHRYFRYSFLAQSVLWQVQAENSAASKR